MACISNMLKCHFTTKSSSLLSNSTNAFPWLNMSAHQSDSWMHYYDSAALSLVPTWFVAVLLLLILLLVLIMIGFTTILVSLLLNSYSDSLSESDTVLDTETSVFSFLSDITCFVSFCIVSKTVRIISNCSLKSALLISSASFLIILCSTFWIPWPTDRKFTWYLF